MKAGRVLRTGECAQIKFSVGNIFIPRYAFNFIAGPITEAKVKITLGGNGYDHKTNTIFWDGLGVRPSAIVHESTHALINALHAGKTITTGMHETAAYLAEAMWCLNSKHDIDTDVPHLDARVRELGKMANDYYAMNPSGTFDCPAEYVAGIIKLLKNTPRLTADYDEAIVQVGICNGSK